MMLFRLISGLIVASALYTAAPHRSSAAADDDGIRVLVGQSPPSVRLEGGILTGYWVELSRLAAARAQVPIISVDPLPYARALRDVADGKNLCHPFVARIPERDSRYRWVAPTRRIVISVFTIAGAPDSPTSIEALKLHKLAVQRDTFGDATLEALGIPAMRVTNTNQLAEVLLHRRVSVFVAEYASGIAAAREAAIEIAEAMQLSETFGYFACSPQLDAAISERLARAINGIFTEGLDRDLAAADGEDDVYERVRPPTR